MAKKLLQCGGSGCKFMLQIQVAVGEHLIAILEKMPDKPLLTSKMQKDEKNSTLVI